MASSLSSTLRRRTLIFPESLPRTFPSVTNSISIADGEMSTEPSCVIEYSSLSPESTLTQVLPSGDSREYSLTPQDTATRNERTARLALIYFVNISTSMILLSTQVPSGSSRSCTHPRRRPLRHRTGKNRICHSPSSAWPFHPLQAHTAA